MNIQIFGYGFVGKAHALAFSPDYSIYDPALGYTEINADADAVIIAVSTPSAFPNNGCDMVNVIDAISQAPHVPILIKSTISLEGWRLIKEQFPDKDITFSPEFLRADSAMEDFKAQEVCYVGGDNTFFWSDVLTTRLGVRVEVGEPEALIIAKYMRNSFLATKVAFFNQVYDLCQNQNIDADYSEVCHFITDDPRIGNSHTFVTDERGFGGHCFPKDTMAITETAYIYGENLSIINGAIRYNDRIRK